MSHHITVKPAARADTGRDQGSETPVRTEAVMHCASITEELKTVKTIRNVFGDNY